MMLSTMELWDLAIEKLKMLAHVTTSKEDAMNLNAAADEVKALIEQNKRFNDVIRGKVLVTVIVDVPENS